MYITPREPLFRPARQAGVTLVETLVAALVLAVGVVGTALLFLHGVQANRSALLREAAVHLAADLAERIRANRLGRAAYAGDSLTSVAGARAARDLAEWRQAVVGALPAPRTAQPPAQVQFRAGASSALPDRYRILLAWSEPGQRAVWTQSHVLELLPGAAP